MWTYPNVVDGTCEVLMLLAMASMKLSKIKVSIGSSIVLTQAENGHSIVNKVSRILRIFVDFNHMKS
jgi:hypothetical protein